MARLSKQQLARAQALVKANGHDDDEAITIVEAALADVIEQAQARGLDSLSRPRRLLLGLCELHIGVSTEGLAFTLLNGWNLIPSMREACLELRLPAALDVLNRAEAMIPKALLSHEGEDAAAEAWLEGLSEDDMEAFEDLEDEMLDNEPDEGYAGVALAWIARHGPEFS